MPKSFRAPTGTFDYLPDDHTYFTFIKKVVRHRFRQAGFKRISTPSFEETESFAEALGENTQIVSRELYTFADRTGRDLSLRPEITTGIVRSFIQHKMDQQALPVELYYVERCYRFERPDQRTRREFWQIGAEVLGESDPSIDAQIIYLGHQMLKDLQIRSKCELKISTIGSPEDRAQFFEAVANFYAGKERSLTPESQENLRNKKYLELLNPKSEDEEILAKMAPKITDFLSDESRKFFDDVLEYLNSFGIEYQIDYSLVRPIDYYSNTVFEFREKETSNKVLVGGRYDHLIEKMGGKPNGGVGFATGVERIIQLMKDSGIEVPYKDYLQIFLAATGPVAKPKALPILVKLREHGFHAVGVLGRTSMQEQLERAQTFKVPYTLLVGDLEVKKNQIIVRDMSNGKQEWVAQENIIEHMDKLLGVPKKLDTSKDMKLDTTTDFLGTRISRYLGLAIVN